MPTAALALFVAFEFLRAAHAHSIVLAMFGLLDVVIIVLVLREYRTLRARRRSAGVSDGAGHRTGRGW